MSNTSIPLSQKCFSDAQMLLMSYLEKKINNFIFPVQFAITVLGNLLTMSVLLSGLMKNRANHLLASLALCDILLYVMMLPHYLASLDTFALNIDFRLFTFYTKVHFGALSNWFSAAAIWFVLAVSIERLLIIKYPFRSLDGYNTKQVFGISLAIFATTLLLTSYHHFSHTCMSWVVCNGTQAVGICYPNVLPSFGRRPNPTSSFTKHWINFSVYLNAGLAVLLPICAVAVINISLIRLLKRRRSEDMMLNSNRTSNSTSDQERKMTHTVVAIVSCFTLTQGPSAIVFTLQRFYPASITLRYVSIIANQLVLTGKMLNVVLFCLTSQTFRRKLINNCRVWMIKILYCHKPEKSSYFSRELSKSVITQKTSIMYSPSARTGTSSRSDSVSMRNIKSNSEQLPLNPELNSKTDRPPLAAQ